MDYEKALNFLATKGLSFYASEEFRISGKQKVFDPISRWGLGFLSCFLIASEVVIETKKGKGDACKFLIRNVGEGWRYEQGSLEEPGTMIRLTLNDFGRGLELERVIRYYVKECSVPIIFGKDLNEPLRFDWGLTDQTIQEELKEYLRGKEAKVVAEDTYEDDEVKVRIYWLSEHFGRTYIANQGFFVQSWQNRETPLPSGTTVLLSSKKELFDVDVSRDNIRIDTPKFESFKDIWFKILVEFLNREWMRKSAGRESSTVRDWIEFETLLSTYNISLPYLHLALKPKTSFDTLPQTARNFAKTKVNYLVLTKKGVDSVPLTEIITKHPSLIILYFLGNVGVNDVQNQIRFVQTFLSGRLTDSDLVLFQLGRPFYMSSKENPYEEFLKFFVDPSIKIVLHDLLTLNREIEFKKEQVDLDILLPKGSYFSHIPELLRGCVICKMPFRIRVEADFPQGDDEAFFDIVLGGFWSDDSSKKNLRRRLPYLISAHMLGTDEKKEGIEITEMAKLVYDIEDPFNKLLIRNVANISGNLVLEKILKDYFGELALFYLFPNKSVLDSLLLRESEILALLGVTVDVAPLPKRAGPLWLSLINNTGVIDIQYMPSRFVTIEPK